MASKDITFIIDKFSMGSIVLLYKEGLHNTELQN